MLQVLVTLVLRVIAWALVTYGLTSLDMAVMLTSDPDAVQAVSALVAAGVVMVTEEMNKLFGKAPSKFIMGILERVLSKVSNRFVVKRE